MEGESTSFSEQCAAARKVQLDNPVIQFTHRSRAYPLHLGVFNPTVRMRVVAGKRGKATHAFPVVMRTEVMLHRYAEWGAKGREYVMSRPLA